jgi:NAD(P) transhydrogenase subunit alpha
LKIGIPRERRAHERRVAGTPDTVKKLVGQGHEVLVETYEQAGARLVDTGEAFGADVVLKVQRPLGPDEGDVDELSLMTPGTMLVGMLNPYMKKDQVKAYAERGLTAFAMELLPRTTRAQVMDVLSSQANLAGYKAVVDAFALFTRVAPMMMTAAGTVPPAKVFVMGAGVAGLQAIATARRLGAVVSATDVRAAASEEVKSLGAKFVGIEEMLQADKAAGGYAKELTAEQREKQAQLVADTLKQMDIVVTTALIPGRKAPVLVTSAMVESMKPGAVIVDLAVENGGNCDLSRYGEVIEHQGVTIAGYANMPARIAPASSNLYARNLFNFLGLLVDKEKGLVVNEEDDLVKGTLLTRDGQVVHPQLAESQAA